MNIMSLRVKEYIQLKYILYFYFNLFLKLPATMSPFAKQFERSNGISIVLRQDIERTSFAEKVPQDLQARQKIEQFFRYEVLNNQNSLVFAINYGGSVESSQGILSQNFRSQ